MGGGVKRLFRKVDNKVRWCWGGTAPLDFKALSWSVDANKHYMNA